MSDLDTINLIKAFLAAPAGLSALAGTLAWEDFFLIHDPLIRGAIRKCHGRWEEVDDLDQEVWIILIRRLPKLAFDPARGTLREWVLAIARKHAAWSAARHSRRRDETLTAERIAALLDPDSDPVAECERKELQEQVRAILAKLGLRLSELSRQIIAMRLIEGQSVAAIAAALDVSVDCVKMRLRRARAELRDLLRERGLGPS